MKNARQQGCNSKGDTSWAWVDPRGRVFETKDTIHEYWAVNWLANHPEVAMGLEDPDMPALDALCSLGWVRVGNWLNMDVWEMGRVGPAAWRAVAALMARCPPDNPNADPEEEVVRIWEIGPSRVLKLPLPTFLQRYCGREALNQVYEAFLARVAVRRAVQASGRTAFDPRPAEHLSGRWSVVDADEDAPLVEFSLHNELHGDNDLMRDLAVTTAERLQRRVGSWTPGTFLHGTDQRFDRFRPGAHKAIYFSPTNAGRKTQAEYISEGPLGGWLAEVRIAPGKPFDPYMDPVADEIRRRVSEWGDRERDKRIPYDDAPAIIKAAEPLGYNRFTFYEDSVGGSSIAVTDPSLIHIVKWHQISRPGLDSQVHTAAKYNPIREPQPGEPMVYHLTGYHATPVGYWRSIRQRGLVPGFNKPPGQDWHGEWSGIGIYFHLTFPGHEIDNGWLSPDEPESFNIVIEADIRIGPGYVVPDEEAGKPEDTPDIVRTGGPIAVAIRIPPTDLRAVHVPDIPAAREWARTCRARKVVFHDVGYRPGRV